MNGGASYLYSVVIFCIDTESLMTLNLLKIMLKLFSGVINY